MIRGLPPEIRSGRPAARLWIGLAGAAGVALSSAFACATPFAAFGMLAAFTLRGREAFGLMLFVWLANQAIGFGLLHYPWTGSTLGWGAAIGVAASAGLIAAQAVARRRRLALPAALPLALTVAFTAYEAVLFAATCILPSGPGAFAPAVVARVLAINAAAAGLLLGVRGLAGMAGWQTGARHRKRLQTG